MGVAKGQHLDVGWVVDNNLVRLHGTNGSSTNALLPAGILSPPGLVGAVPTKLNGQSILGAFDPPPFMPDVGLTVVAGTPAILLKVDD
jgi:hypothetical protein